MTEQPGITMIPLNEIGAALAKAQGEMKNPAFDSTNPHFQNKFASLAAVRNAVVPALAKHGLSVIQNLTTQDGAIACSTTLLHSSGQSMTFGPLVLPATKADAQGYGSAATYARRYSLMAVAGVVGDDDDDANAATGKTNQERISKSQVADLKAKLEEVQGNRENFLKYVGVERFEDILAANYAGVIKTIQAKRARK